MSVNRYRARCSVCGALVPAKGGTLTKENGAWVVKHLACAKGEPAVMTVVIGDREYTRNARGRCEDAPCCGCCTI